MQNVRWVYLKESGANYRSFIRVRAKMQRSTSFEHFKEFLKIPFYSSMRSRRLYIPEHNGDLHAFFFGSHGNEESKLFFPPTAHMCFKNCLKKLAYFYFLAHRVLVSYTVSLPNLR